MRKRAPRVLHLASTWFGTGSILGGAERYGLGLARALARRVPTRLVSFGSTGRAWRQEGLEIRILPACRLPGDPLNALSPALLREFAWADLIHLHQARSLPGDLALLAGRLTGRRMFATDLGAGARYALSYHLPLLKGIRSFLAISEYAAGLHRAAGEPTRVVGAGVDTERFTPGEGPRRREALFVGRLLPHKGLEDLIRAAGDGLPVRIVGSALDPSFHQRLVALARGKPVRFELSLDDDALVEAYRGSAVTVLPSTQGELLGQTLLESLACGTPAVCTRVGGMPEAVEGCPAATVAPPSSPGDLRSAILRWLDLPEEARPAAAEAARRHVLARFRWEEAAQRCLEAYQA